MSASQQLFANNKQLLLMITKYFDFDSLVKVTSCSKEHYLSIKEIMYPKKPNIEHVNKSQSDEEEKSVSNDPSK